MTIIYGTGFEMGTKPMPDGQMSAPTVATIQTVDGSISPKTGTYMCRISGGWWRVVAVGANEIYFGAWINPRDFWTFFGGTPGTGSQIFAELSDGTLVGLYWNETNKSYDFYVNAVLTDTGVVLGLTDDEAWFYLEVRILIANAGGRCVAYLDGQEIINFTGDTQPGATDQISWLRLNSSMAFRNMHIDDITVDTAAFPGDIRYDGLFPNADAGPNQWNPSAATSFHYQLVDEKPASDADFVETSFSGFVEMYDLEDWDNTDKTPVVVVHWSRVSKSSAGGQRIVQRMQSGATLDQSAVKPLFTSPFYINEIHNQDPNGPAAWTDAAIDALEIGQEARI